MEDEVRVFNMLWSRSPTEGSQGTCSEMLNNSVTNQTLSAKA